MNEERRERGLKLRVGVFVLIAVAAFLGMIYALGARARLFEARYAIHADFTEVGGLTDGATVRLAGVQIGRVTGVHLPGQPGGKVRVDLTVAKQYGDRIRKDSIARIETQGLLGDKIVEITVGTAEMPAVQPGETIGARDPVDIGQVISEGAQTVKSVAALAEGLRRTAETVTQSKLIEDLSATASSARRLTEEVGRDIAMTVSAARRLTDQVGRVVDQVEKGRGWAHVLLYEEPEALRRLNELLATTQSVLDRLQRGEGAAGVLTSTESAEAARGLVRAMERIGQMVDRPTEDEGLLPGLLFDPKYRTVLDDLRVVTRNFREVSDRLAGGRGTLGGLLKDEADEGGIRQASRDLRDALANLKSITQKINEGEGTVGALIADPTLYERLVTILDNAQRSFLLRSLIRGLAADRDKRTERKP
jgi:phospholipid/cholesterol/gamma-HCH transport system substrate-binding protein